MSQKRTKFKWKQLWLKMIVVWKPKTIKEREHNFRELGIFELEGDPKWLSLSSALKWTAGKF